MPYKDKEKERKGVTERVRRYRDKQKGVTNEGVTEQGVTKVVIPGGANLYWYKGGKREELSEVPEGYKVLSDGQVWKPMFKQKSVKEADVFSDPIMKHIIPGKNRDKMERIVKSLNEFRVLNHVFYGIGMNSILMTLVEGLLDCTESTRKGLKA